MDDRVLEKKKGLNLMTKILITALIPLDFGCSDFRCVNSFGRFSGCQKTGKA